MMSVKQSMEWKLARETEVLGENLPQRHFAHDKPTWPDLGSNLGRRGGKPATNRLSYGAVSTISFDAIALIRGSNAANLLLAK
jgi:hypothetical protein